MANPTTVDARIRRWVRPPPAPTANMRPTHAGTYYRPFAALSPAQTAPNMRPLRVPVAPTPPYSFARWEGAAPGAKKNDLPRYMFKPDSSPTGGGPGVATLLRLGPRAGT